MVQSKLEEQRDVLNQKSRNMTRGKEGYLTQSYYKNPYTNRKFENQ